MAKLLYMGRNSFSMPVPSLLMLRFSRVGFMISSMKRFFLIIRHISTKNTQDAKIGA